MAPKSCTTKRWRDIAHKFLAVPRFYAAGFRTMTVGRSLWLVIAIKIVVLFGVLKLVFFPDFLDTRFDNDADRSNYVLEQITSPATTRSAFTGEEAHD